MNQQIFEEIKSLKRRLLPDEKVILFGSRARGDERKESDWDLLILLNRKEKIPEDEDKYALPFVLMGWKYGTYISVKLYSAEEWKKRQASVFRSSVEQDGIEIV
ncbi:MAG: nucleotidyltransferase domain-containing protein [Prevotellaceae bacterium]|jgi:predicted nucleotidyltransferase|nr:nucleotidyltransferase domain-containing protein [Prevotellaceae bacterium]